MKKPPKFKRKGKKEAAPTSTVSPWKERLVVAACVAGLMGVLALIGTVMGIGAQRQALDKQFAKWKTLYHLTDEQAARLRQMELDFHGNGNPFTSRESGTPEENLAHHLKMSRVMSPEAGERFFRDIQHSKGQH